MSYRLRPPRKGKSKHWSAIITTPNVRTFERSTKCARKSEASAVAQRWDREAALSRNQVSLEQAFEMLRQHYIDKGNSEARHEILELKVAHLLGFFGRERPVDTMQLADSLAYMRHRRQRGVSDTTIGMELGKLRAALTLLRRHKLYDGDPKDMWPTDELKPSQPRDRWLTLPQYEKLLLAMAAPTGYHREQRFGAGVHGGAERRRQWIQHKEPFGQDWRDHLVLYTYTGMRLSELYRLEAADIDGDHLHIRGTKTEGADRTIPIHEQAAEVLKRRRKERPRGALFPMTSPSWEAQERAWLRALSRGCERAGIPHASTNDLRRTFCSWCWQDGIPLEVCAEWLGHEGVRMAREVYAHMSREAGAEHMQKLRSPRRLQPPTNIPARRRNRGNAAPHGATES